MVTDRDDFAIAFRSAFLKKGAQQKFSLFILIVVSLLILYVDTFDTKPLNVIRSIFKDGIYKVSTVISLPEKSFIHLSRGLTNHLTVHNKNKELNESISLLKERSYENTYLKFENTQLKKLLNQKVSSNYSYTTARVTIDKESPYLKSVILNVGSNQNIKKGMAVLDGKIFVGRIVEVNYLSSRVLLLTDLNSKIPVIIEPMGHQAILSGTNENEPTLEFLPANHELSSGNTVYTSGKGGIFLAGIPIGEVNLVGKKIFVSLFSDLHQLAFVNVDIGRESELD